MRFRLLGVLFLCAAPLWGQSAAIRVGHLIDPASGSAASNQIIFVKEGKIAAVGPDVVVPEGVPWIDLSNSWVLPGLMDAHTHITFGQGPPINIEASYLAESSALRALRGLHNARAVLEKGFTTIRDAGNDAGYSSIDLRHALEKRWFQGPTIVTMGKIIGPFGGQSHGIPLAMGPFWRFEYIDADTPDEMRKAVRQNIFYGAQEIKLVCDSSAYHCSVEEVRAAVRESHAAGMRVSVHVMGGEAARNVILGGADSIEHGFELSDELLGMMKEKGMILVSTDIPYEHLALTFPPGNAFGFDAKALSSQILDRLKRARRIGVKLAFGTDTVIDVPGRTRGEMMLDYLDVWDSAGIPPADALKSMTTIPAELLQVQGSRGAIAPGQAADIIATSENPLEHIQALKKVHFVMKDGEMIRGPDRARRSD